MKLGQSREWYQDLVSSDVIVWLGRDRHGTVPVTATMLHNMGRLHDHLWPNNAPPKDRTITRQNVPGLLARFDLPDIQNEAWLSLASFFSRKWFTRLWVVQEVVLSQHLSPICGSEQIEWSDIHRSQAVLLCGLSELLVASNHSIVAVQPQGVPGTYQYLSELTSRHGRLDVLRRLCRLSPQDVCEDGYVDLMGKIIAGPLSPERKAVNMIGGIALFLTKEFRATDPRDQVYGLVGLIEHLIPIKHMFAVVDYKKTPLEVLTTAVRRILLCDWMDLLSLFGMKTRPGSWTAVVDARSQ